MATLNLNAATLALRATPLTAKVFKQLPIVTWTQVRHLLSKDNGSVMPDAMPVSTAPQKFLGWIHGAGVGTDSNDRWLIVDFGDGVYGRFLAMHETLKGVPQIYVA